MSDTLKSIIALTLTCFCAGCIVIFFHTSFNATIEKNVEKSNAALVQRIFPAQTDIVAVIGQSPLSPGYWVGKKDSLVIGYAFPVAVRDYSGEIEIIVGIDTSGTIVGMAIVSESRSPGIGISFLDRLSVKTLWDGFFKKKNNSSSWFTDQFVGTRVTQPFAIDASHRHVSLTDEQKGKNREENVVSAVAGATLSTRAIVRSIEKNAAAFFAVAKGVRK
jgi:Na+-translocating ferredoxin:NAD+ oxidoreductase RnfG subunit